MKSNKKRSIIVFAILTMALVLSFVFVACDKVEPDKTGTDADMEELEGIYYAVKNGKFESDNWFNISKDGTWTDDDDLNGTWTVRGNRICFNWAFSLDGIIDGDSFYLIELDEVVEYVRRDSAPKQGEFWTDKYVILLDTNGGSVSKEILKCYKGDKVNLPTPEKENEKFKGWFDFFGNKYSTGSSMPAQNIVLYAKWEKKVTDYSDEYVFFSPAIEGKKHSDEYYYLYPNISKYIYVELTCDSVGGKYNLGTPSNFDLLHHIDMKYHVQSSDYQLKWYYGDWSQPNGSQTFTLNYGSNIQLLAVENSQGQIQCRYLLDFYVKRDVEVELYRSISATSSYETVRGYVDEMIDETDLNPYEYDEFDYWLCYDSTTKSYKPYDFTTILTGDIALYQSLKGVEVNVDLNGGTMTEASLRIKPYEKDQLLPVAEKEGYDFIGWMDSDGNYYIGYDGSLLFAVTYEKMPKKLTASFIPKKYYANISGKNVKFVDTKVYVIYGFTSVDKIGYKIATNIDNEVTNYLFEIGDEFYVSGYAIEGVYDEINKLNEDGKALILTQDLLNKTLSLNMIKFPIKLEKNIDVAGSVKYDGVAYIGAELSITATTETGFTFMGWYDGDTLLTSEYTYTFVLSTENKTYTAKWDSSYIVPEGTTSIGVSQFKNWAFLTSITIPGSVTSIGNSAFSGCTGLTSITIPNSVTSIGDDAFYDCTGLTKIIGPSTVASTVAKQCGSKSFEVVITSGTSIGSSAFHGCTGLTSLIIPDNVTSIDKDAFYGCTGLTNITIPNSVTSIGSQSFYGCTGLTSITIPDSVTSIGRAAFSYCSSLESITIPFVGAKAGVTSNDKYQYPFGYIFGTNSYTGGVATKQYYYGDSTYSTTSTTYYIPSSLKSVTVTGGNILFGAFYNCTGLTILTLGNSVTSIGNSAFYNCTGLTSVTIGNSVTSIGKGTFYGCSGLTSVTIGNGVKSIDKNAFTGCNNLQDIYITDIAAWCNISGLDNLMDYGSSNKKLYINNELVTSVTIPDGVTIVPSSAFRGCSSLTSVTIPDSVTSIGSYAFRNCSKLQNIYITDIAAWCNISGLNNLMVYGSKKLYINNELATSITIPNGVKTIPSYAFRGCTGLMSITIPDGVTSIGMYAFSGCSKLTSITIPESVTSIGNYAFDGCSGLTSVTIPDSVTSIGNYAFHNCSSLTSVTIPDGVTIIPSSAFRGCSNLTSVTIGNNVTSIGIDAFRDCIGLTSITIPDSVTSIGDSAFSGCTGLKSVTIGNNVTSIGIDAFRDCIGLTSITIPDSVTSIGSNAFYECSRLTSVTIGNGVTSIGDNAFYNCIGLTSITIPDSVSGIGREAFSGCTGLTTVNWNATACTSADSSDYPIFRGCSNLATINIGDNVTTIPSYAFYNSTGLTSVTIGNGVTSIGESAFSGCIGLTSITIPDSVTSIGDGAFYNTAWYNNQPNGLVYAGKVAYKYKGTMPSNTSIVLKEGTLSIVFSAFRGCTGLTSVTIPDSVTSIGNYAFEGCTRLTSITGPAEIVITVVKQASPTSFVVSITSGTSIGSKTFRGCTGLKSVTIGNSVTSIGNSAFDGCTGLKSVTIGNSVTSIGNSAFDGCTGLTSITIGNGVTSIGDYAFYGCSKLMAITIPDSVTSIGDGVFKGCTSLTSITFNGTTAQWKAISKGSEWNKNVPATDVYCTDGAIIIK